MKDDLAAENLELTVDLRLGDVRSFRRVAGLDLFDGQDLVHGHLLFALEIDRNLFSWQVFQGGFPDPKA
jgi:hypothetical protein